MLVDVIQAQAGDSLVEILQSEASADQVGEASLTTKGFLLHTSSFRRPWAAGLISLTVSFPSSPASPAPAPHEETGLVQRPDLGQAEASTFPTWQRPPLARGEEEEGGSKPVPPGEPRPGGLRQSVPGHRQ